MKTATVPIYCLDIIHICNHGQRAFHLLGFSPVVENANNSCKAAIEHIKYSKWVRVDSNQVISVVKCPKTKTITDYYGQSCCSENS